MSEFKVPVSLNVLQPVGDADEGSVSFKLGAIATVTVECKDDAVAWQIARWLIAAIEKSAPKDSPK